MAYLFIIDSFYPILWLYHITIPYVAIFVPILCRPCCSKPSLVLYASDNLATLFLCLLYERALDKGHLIMVSKWRCSLAITGKYFNLDFISLKTCQHGLKYLRDSLFLRAKDARWLSLNLDYFAHFMLSNNTTQENSTSIHIFP